jgi:hypothetical protein
MSNEAKMTEERVRNEHIKAVNVGAHWVYLWGVILGALVAMVAFIGLLGAGGG